MSGYPFTAKTTPPIDLLILTHDHWDHLDCETIKALDDKVKRYAVPLGVNSHLLAWGINPDKILVFDWDDAARAHGFRGLRCCIRSINRKSVCSRLNGSPALFRPPRSTSSHPATSQGGR